MRARSAAILVALAWWVAPVRASPITFTTPCGCVWELVPPQVDIDTDPDPPQTYDQWLEDLNHEPPPPDPIWVLVSCPPWLVPDLPEREGHVPEPKLAVLWLVATAIVACLRRHRANQS